MKICFCLHVMPRGFRSAEAMTDSSLERGESLLMTTDTTGFQVSPVNIPHLGRLQTKKQHCSSIQEPVQCQTLCQNYVFFLILLIFWLLTSPCLATHSLAQRGRVENTFTLSQKVEYIGVDLDESEVLKQQFRQADLVC